MKTAIQNRSLRFDDHVHSALAGTIGACRQLTVKFHALKDRLLERLGRELENRVPAHMLEQAVLEAEALAWSTPYPLLFLPVLAEEKAQSTRQWAERQRQILRRQIRF